MTRVSITEARRRLPELVRQVKQDRGSVVQITVRDEVVAELRAALPQPEPGAAARALLELAGKLPKRRGPRRDISSHVKESAGGREGCRCQRATARRRPSAFSTTSSRGCISRGVSGAASASAER